ncbi:MAG TPA: hypothetical protein VMG60_24020 [Burkholderiaceae bacterium]|nr:hypothetical protein [Burkholderiaceae bacterium]
MDGTFLAGFGRHHVMHEDRFIELGGSLIVEIEFIVSDAEKKQILDLVKVEKVRPFYAEIPARFGELGPAMTDTPPAQQGDP